MKIKILGNGAWGNALFKLIKHNNSSVSIWDKKEKVDDIDILVLSIPTQSIRTALKFLGSFKKNVIVVNTAKGIEINTHKLPFEIIKELINSNFHYFSLIGPSFAEEVINKMPTLVNLGYKNPKYIDIIKNLFQTDYFRVKPVAYVRSLELAGALKNVYAIACGIADGLGFGINTRTKLILLAMDEFYDLCKKLGYKASLQALPGTIGDLILTCSSSESRNFSFGKYLAKHKVKESMERVKSTIEGFYTSASVKYFTNKNNIKLPLASFVTKIILVDKPQEVKIHFAEFVKNV